MESYLAHTCALGGSSGFEAPDPILTCGRRVNCVERYWGNLRLGHHKLGISTGSWKIGITMALLPDIGNSFIHTASG